MNRIIDALVGGKINGKFDLKRCTTKSLKRAAHAILATSLGLKVANQDQTVDVLGLNVPVSLITGLITQGIAMLLNWHRERAR